MAVLRGDGGWRGRLPGVSGEYAAQDGHDVLAVLAGGVDVAADVEPVLGGVVAGQAAGYLLLGFQRADAALADVVRRPDTGVRGEPEYGVLAVRQNSSSSRPGCCFVVFFGPGMRGRDPAKSFMRSEAA